LLKNVPGGNKNPELEDLKKNLYIYFNAQKKKFHDISRQNLQMKTKIRALQKEVEKNKALVEKGQQVFLNTYNDNSAIYTPNNRMDRSNDVNNVRNLKKHITAEKKNYQDLCQELDDVKRKLRCFKPKFVENELMMITKESSEVLNEYVHVKMCTDTDNQLNIENDRLSQYEHDLIKDQRLIFNERNNLMREVDEKYRYIMQIDDMSNEGINMEAVMKRDYEELRQKHQEAYDKKRKQ